MAADPEGFMVFDRDGDVARWAEAARGAGIRVSRDRSIRADNLRHAGTWFVGVDALPNDPTGAVDGVPLAGPWKRHVSAPASWHAAQLSIVYPGYPGQDSDESDANHAFRIKRHAAHVDGLLPEGPDRRRFLREPHAFILGLPLNTCAAAPLMVWPGSHLIMGTAFRAAIGTDDPATVDLTDPYQAARRQVFEQIRPRALHAVPGQSILLHRHLLHGVAPWQDGVPDPGMGRMIAYFRPQFTPGEWLSDRP
jgi:hypothetical protein